MMRYKQRQENFFKKIRGITVIKNSKNCLDKILRACYKLLWVEENKKRIILPAETVETYCNLNGGKIWVHFIQSVSLKIM
jgi:hypothetical protein